MKRDVIFRSFIKEIERMPKIEVIVYAALNIKRCSYFYRKEALVKILKEQNIDEQKFSAVLRGLNLKIRKEFYIAARDWPNLSYFDKKYKLASICRNDNAIGMFLDIPRCCAETYAKYGDKRDRTILKKHPFRGASAPEEIYIPAASNKKWWKEFSEHFYMHRNSVYDRSEEIRSQIERSIETGALPKEMPLLFSTFIPCKANCRKFITQANKMNHALKKYLSPARYDEIINAYINRKIYL